MHYKSNETDKMAGNLCNMIKKRFGNRVYNFAVLDVIDDPNWREFGIEFYAYDY